VKTLQPLTSERGAILINAALTLLVWFGIATFVADYGVLWVSRHQAQNAADAGALTGALTRAYDDFDDPPASGGDTAMSVSQVVGANAVWGTATPQVTSFTCPADVGAPRRCVRVDVYRNGVAGSTPLPTWFANVVGTSGRAGDGHRASLHGEHNRLPAAMGDPRLVDGAKAGARVHEVQLGGDSTRAF
jgi:Flp pilus assembly protein TadG